MAERQKRRFWRICRIYFRRFRIAVWVLILFILASLIYVNQVGLPGFVKRPLLDKLRERGVELQFSRLRLSWYRGIVAENVKFGPAAEKFGPQLKLSQVRVQVNWKALTHLRLQVDALELNRGRFSWPIPGTNTLWREISAENIQTELRFLPNDEWSLDNFRAVFAGGNIQLSGNVTNASRVRDWKFLQARPGAPTPAGALQERLGKLADVLEQIHFSTPPELRLQISGDAGDLQSFQMRIILNTPGAETPWGNVSQGRFIARLYPAGTNQTWGEINLEAADAQTRWGVSTNLHFVVNLVSLENHPDLVSARLVLSADIIETKWATASAARFTADWVHSLTNPVPLSGNGILECRDPSTQWGRATTLRVAASLATPTNLVPSADPSWAWWARLQPYSLDWDAHLTGISSPKLDLDGVSCAGHWAAPVLTVTNLQADLYERHVGATAELDVVTRGLKTHVAGDLDSKRIYPLLTEGARHWLDQFTWDTPPTVEADIAVTLPAWTNRAPDWRGEVQPTLLLNGAFRAPAGGEFHGIPIQSAQSHFTYSNMIWRLPDLVATRPEGRIEALHIGNDRTHQFYWHVTNSIAPQSADPFLDEHARRILELFGFSQPPHFDAEIWGHWHHADQTGIKAALFATNFTFRGEHLDEFITFLEYTNKVLRLTNPHGRAGRQVASAATVIADFEAQKIFLTNGYSTADPQFVARAIGPGVSRTIEPYRFLNPPVARVNGVIPMRRPEDADVQFDISGGPFHWWKFNLANISGRLNWTGLKLTLNEVHTGFYGGAASGSAEFDFTRDAGTDYRFVFFTTNTQLKSLMADLTGRTNNPEGILNGSLVVSKASTSDPKALTGHGGFMLRDGLIWAIPMFGVLSPALDSLVPGLGSSRATFGSGSFVIRNGVIRSDDLEIRSPAMRVEYRGTVTVDGQMNARVEAELLRDMWLVGPVVSTVLWPVTKLFEYKVTGGLSQPKIEPLYLVPKLVLLPFHPFRTIKELIPEDTSTNSPPRIQ
jgi:hypothetical protein